MLLGLAGDGSDIGDILGIYSSARPGPRHRCERRRRRRDHDQQRRRIRRHPRRHRPQPTLGQRHRLDYVVYTNTTGDLSVAALEGTSLGVWLGFDEPDILTPASRSRATWKSSSRPARFRWFPSRSADAARLIGLATTSRRLEAMSDA